MRWLLLTLVLLSSSAGLLGWIYLRDRDTHWRPPEAQLASSAAEGALSELGGAAPTAGSRGSPSGAGAAACRSTCGPSPSTAPTASPAWSRAAAPTLHELRPGARSGRINDSRWRGMRRDELDQGETPRTDWEMEMGMDTHRPDGNGPDTRGPGSNRRRRASRSLLIALATAIALTAGVASAGAGPGSSIAQG